MVDHNSNSNDDANDKLCGNYSEYYNDIQQQRLNQGLYVVSTPIGNLGDITLRALHTLQKSDIILCEDMRVSRKLLSFYNISAKRLLSYHEHNNTARIPYILELLGEGKIVSLISDAGTPIINDPGYKLLLSCYERGYYVTHLPGACSVINGIVLSGLPSSSFTYLGFFPYKSSGRRAILGRYSNSSETLIFLETPHRIFDTLKDIEFVLGSEREIVIMRELTKKFEERIAGMVGAILSNYERYVFRGEMIVLLKGGRGILQEDEVVLLLRRKLEYLKVKDAVKEISLISGKSSKDLYRLALELKEDES